MKHKHFSLKTTLLSIFGIAVLGLVSYNIKDLVVGTPLKIQTATDGSTLSTPFLPIVGTAKHAREILINGRPIALDRSGAFNDEVLLSPGYNIVEVALKDQFGNEKIKTYQVVVSIPQAVAANPNTPYQ